MPNLLPVTFSGWEIEIIENLSELDRQKEAEGILQGKNITWDISNTIKYNDNHLVVGKSRLVGEDDSGRLVFAGIPYQLACTSFNNMFGVKIPRRDTFPELSTRGCVRGLIELLPDQFAAGTKYKLRLEVRTKVIPGQSFNSLPLCEDIREIPVCIPLTIVIKTDADNLLKMESYDTITSSFDSEVSLKLEVTTDIIDFSTQYPGQKIQLLFSMAGKLITVGKIILSKIEYGV
jgi:hypothetical protein